MTRVVRLADEVDIAGWRDAARRLLAAGVAPHDVIWRVGEGGGDLFAAAPPAREDGAASPLRVPRRFVDLADYVARHRAPSRFDLLYRLLTRLRATPALLDIGSDAEVRAVEAMAKSVRRDRHKMTAFLRFREVSESGAPRYVAWFEPEHFIEEHVAPFFVDRYASMRFTILTPRRSIDWSEGRLSFGPGARREDLPPEDGFSEAWDVYYRSIFNPARLMPQAMKKEMPKKYWRNMPETRLIPELTEQASRRVSTFLAQTPSDVAPQWRPRRAAPDAAAPMQVDDLASARREAQTCRRCPLGAHATQTVFGEGPRDAAILFVGEQPGDREDLVGRPFVGPAGELFDAALQQAGIDRLRCYVTNAVKHFKFEPRGKRRIHKTPSAGEIDICRWWLTRELALVEAPLIVALGATALRAVTGEASARLADWRGRALPLGDGRRLYATVHPSYLLRLPDADAQARETAAFAADLRAVAQLAASAKK